MIHDLSLESNHSTMDLGPSSGPVCGANYKNSLGGGCTVASEIF
jgi:hypothetical protein